MRTGMGLGLPFVKNQIVQASRDVIQVMRQKDVPVVHHMIEDAVKANLNALGPELVVNSGFETEDGWTLGSNTAITGAQAVISSTSAYESVLSQPTNLVAGKTYRYEISIERSSGNTVALKQLSNTIASGLTSGVYSGVYVPTQSNVSLTLVEGNGVSFSGVVKRISIKEIDLTKVRAWQDSAGTVPVTSMEQYVGLLLEKTERGPEATPATFNDWAAYSGGAPSAIDGNTITATAAAQGLRMTVEVESWYEISTEGSYTGAGFTVQAEGFSINYLPANSFGRAIFKATVVGLIIRFAGAGTATFTKFSVKKIPGAHLIQPSNTAARPLLSRRVNLWSASNNLTSAEWTTAASSPVGSLVTESASGALLRRTNAVTMAYSATNPVSYTTAFNLQRGNTDWVRIILGTPSTFGGSAIRVWVNLATGQVGGSDLFGNFALVGTSIVPLSSGGYRVFVTFYGTVADIPLYAAVVTADANLSTNRADIGSGFGVGSSFHLHGADLRLTSDTIGVPEYQRVTSATDYDGAGLDSAGFGTYAYFDGVDDWLETGVVDMTGTAQVSMIASFQQNKGTGTTQVIAEFGPTVDTTVGSFAIMSPVNSGSYLLGCYAKSASVQRSIWANPAVAAVGGKVVAAQSLDMGMSLMTLLANGDVVGSSSDSLGGNLSAQKLYIGRRAGTSSPAKVRIYGVTVVGKLLSDSMRKYVERLHNKKAGAF